jgi:molecular chaperone GrpE
MENTEPAAVQPPDTNEENLSGELEKLARQLGECEAKLAEMRETMLRERAELDNQRKRLQRDVEQARRFANEKLLADLLPVLDNLERALATESGDASAVRGGVELTLRELNRVTEANGLKSVGMAGEPFNPEHHQAMAMVEAQGVAAGAIAAVMQKGYVLNERLLRPALVSVAK